MNSAHAQQFSFGTLWEPKGVDPSHLDSRTAELVWVNTPGDAYVGGVLLNRASRRTWSSFSADRPQAIRVRGVSLLRPICLLLVAVH
jgi:hypothetical protein